MSDKADFLLELGCEELPARVLKPLAEALADGLVSAMSEEGIALDESRVSIWYTPRRLAVRIGGVALVQADQHTVRRGPALSAGLDEAGNPSKALLGFARSCGVDVEHLAKETTDKGEWFVWRSVQSGEASVTRLPVLLGKVVAQLPIAKPMRWGANEFAFARPLHWMVALLGSEVVDLELMGVRSGRLSQGHRFHHPGAVSIADAAEYESALERAHVLVSSQAREQRIVAALDAIASNLGAQAVLNPALVSEVANLTEYPVAVACTFDAAFLKVPAEALVTTMEVNQKFFAIRDQQGELTNSFVGFSNIESSAPQVVRLGYERVIRPRFADAQFFYEADLGEALSGHAEGLQKLAYQKHLGSVWDKTQRVSVLATAIAAIVGVDTQLAARAADLSRCDLMTRMVGEFPELQGTMGHYYALAQGEPEQVAHSLEQFYQPRFSGDSIPGSRLGQLLSVADRLDTLAGIFAVGLKPSGSKDPFALRRCALGLGRILIEGGLDLDLPEQLQQACDQVAFAGTASAAELYGFVIERLRGYFLDAGHTASHFDAVASVSPRSLKDFDKRLEAVAEFANSEAAEALAAANKRINNLLRKNEGVIAQGIDKALFEDEAERTLDQALSDLGAPLESAMQARDYAQALSMLSLLREPVDGFFENVMVMCEDPGLRANRLALLQAISRRFLSIADVAQL